MEDQPQALSKTLKAKAFYGIHRARSTPADEHTGHASVVLAGGACSLAVLDIEGIIDVFVRGLAARLAYASFVYQHDGQGVVYSLGAPARHSLTYRMKFGDDALGKLSITREWPFADGDICWLENRIGGLVHVLHNVLSCRRAPAFSGGEVGAICPSRLLPL